MDFDTYQANAAKTAIYPTIYHRVIYPTLGLAGEVGELVNKLKKVFRDNNGNFTDNIKEQIKAELGDVLWYLSEIANVLGISLSDIAKTNLDKLNDRLNRGQIHGTGDSR
ncbi:MAG: nucleoside triphosphate pyrophosphohydrolase family protein [Candidatus Dojkabacteria bacterium]|nr:nucleoside triphosphate pyrophosphohydrolase family protein [Candidatus Dojkabacteria bacterium]